MIRSSDLVTMIRRRSGLSQARLAARAGVARETISRWEHGDQVPSVEALAQLGAAAGLELSCGLVTPDDSLHTLVDDQLALRPLQRLRSLVRPDARQSELALLTLAIIAPKHVVVGAVADILLGAPQSSRGVVDAVLEHDRHMEISDRLLEIGAWPAAADEYGPQAWELPEGGMLRLVERPTGTRGFADLDRHAETVVLPADRGRAEIRVRVAAPIDLLRIAEADGGQARSRRPGLLALLEARRRHNAPAAAA